LGQRTLGLQEVRRVIAHPLENPVEHEYSLCVFDRHHGTKARTRPRRSGRKSPCGAPAMIILGYGRSAPAFRAMTPPLECGSMTGCGRPSRHASYIGALQAANADRSDAVMIQDVPM